MKTETCEYRLEKFVRWNSNDEKEDVIHFVRKVFIKEWIKCSDKMPPIGQICWCLDKENNLYLCTYSKWSIFRKKPTFNNILGKGWEVQNIVKWQPLITPKL
jgi:hypothetical protein